MLVKRGEKTKTEWMWHLKACRSETISLFQYERILTFMKCTILRSCFPNTAAQGSYIWAPCKQVSNFQSLSQADQIFCHRILRLLKGDFLSSLHTLLRRTQQQHLKRAPPPLPAVLTEPEPAQRSQHCGWTYTGNPGTTQTYQKKKAKTHKKTK